MPASFPCGGKPCLPLPTANGRKTGLAGTISTGTQAPEPLGGLQGPATVYLGEPAGAAAPGVAVLPHSPPAEPRRLSPPLCPPARTAPCPGSWRAGRGPVSPRAPLPICVFGLQSCTPGKGNTERDEQHGGPADPHRRRPDPMMPFALHSPSWSARWSARGRARRVALIRDT